MAKIRCIACENVIDTSKDKYANDVEYGIWCTDCAKEELNSFLDNLAQKKQQDDFYEEHSPKTSDFI